MSLAPVRVADRLLAAGWLLAGLGFAAYPFSPAGTGRTLWYLAVGMAALCLGALGLRRRRPALRTAWALVLLGFAGWVAGDLVWALESQVLGLESYPLPSDALYLGAYGLLTAGCLKLVRKRQRHRDVDALLDALIIATGAAVLAGVFLIAPTAQDSSLSTLGKLVSSAYPLADVVLIAVLMRLWTSPGARTTSFRLLLAAVATTLAGDIAWNAYVLRTGDSGSTALQDMLWLSAYLLAAAAVSTPSVHEVTGGPEGAPEAVDQTRRRLFVLAGGLALPALTLLARYGAPTGDALVIVGIGSLVLTVLVLLRMSSLVSSVEAQAVQLAALARSDHLTGAANRRTWDHELSRACQHSREHRTPLWVALLDLDRFKQFNDTRGHQAGDLLLREAVAAWTHHLDEDAFLSRYGGEEFAILFPRRTREEVEAAVDALRGLTPAGQTFSAGVALWDPRTEPQTAVARADAALYEAKRTGRNRTVVARVHDEADTGAVTPSIVLQPIVDLRTGEVVAEEALSRFPGRDPGRVFEEAHAAGTGAQLEASAALAALAQRGPGRDLSVNFSLDVLAAPGVLEALPEDLTGVVIEVRETRDPEELDVLGRLVAQLHARGAQVGIDGWGKGYVDMDRLLDLEPDVVKLDMSLVHRLDTPSHRALVRAMVHWADEAGARLCAEGVETEEQARRLLDLGVRYGQGFLLGRPEPRRPAVSQGAQGAGGTA